MWRAIAFASLAACYSPELAPCAVRCDNTSPCPNDMTCGSDLHCHAHGDTTMCVNDVVVSVTKAGTGGGTVTSPAGIDCGTSCSVKVAPNTNVALAAVANAGSHFVGWTGGCTGTDTCVIVATSDQTATAAFNLAAELDVTFPGAAAGTVTSVPAGIDCSMNCKALFDLGTTVSLTPMSPNTFMGWTGACTGTGACDVVLDSMKVVGADFE